MTKKTTLLKQSGKENLLALKRAIDDGSLEELISGDSEWGGAYVVISSSADFIENHRKNADENPMIDSDTYVLTKHSIALSGIFRYVKENVMEERDFHLYGFMAILANDFLRQFGDPDDSTFLLEYVFEGISFYCQFNDWECGTEYDFGFEIMRFFLSENISDEEIRHIL
ncbi:MAG: hypothetical protein E7Z77_00715 [Methanobrevibacter sp.]|uniref:hypothetical protein n=1 Tax=Methanobrevibacter sp. TaxID=66852 RepID=UPI0025D7EED6|nr:hypothetical protein [Methanobrevibacter sp.]MBE6507913.1 hypothetical protein [Methanobrevibacter sp.]